MDILGHVPEILELNWKRFAFNFLATDHAQWVLGKNWKINVTPFLLKPWTSLFDAAKERMNIILVWVRLPGLPFHFWEVEFLRVIGNHLGEFLEFNYSFMESGERKVSCILVSLNLREGLGEEVDIFWRNFSHTQKIDYENVSFRCYCCHHYGHLLDECNLPLRSYQTTSIFTPSRQETRDNLEVREV
jgi:hypothetical protein